MLKFTVQSRSNKVDIFGLFSAGATQPTLRVKPVELVIGKPSTSPEHALVTLPVKEARELANSILRATGKGGD